MLGQGIRATIGLKNASNLPAGAATQQSAFSAAYFFLSLMIGFIAGVLGGLVVGLNNFVHVDLSNLKVFFGIAAAGYAGADFIENSMSLVITASTPAAVAPQAGAPAAPAAPPAASNVVPPAGGATGPQPDGSASLTTALSIVAPKVRTDIWAPALTAAFAKFDVNTDRRVAAAIGQFLVEAGSAFQEVVENLNYTHADRLVAVFPHEFPTVLAAQPFVGHPEALGNRVYANRLGNGDEQSGDGYRFRGRGLIQLTGRSEYAEFGLTIGKSAEDAAAYCETTEGAAMSGCWYLSSRGCLPLADAWQLSAITEKVNGSKMLGNAQRIAFAEAMLKHL